MSVPAPMLPDYGGACLSSLLPALARRASPEAPGWLPRPAAEARQVVLLVLDGLGWDQLRQSHAAAPTLASGTGGPITSVVPTTTATALTSITTGSVPAEHGIVGYRMRVPGDEVLNVLRWRTQHGDARQTLAPRVVQRRVALAGDVPVVTRAEFAPTGFSAAHLGSGEVAGWRMPSTIAVEVQRLLGAGAPLVYAYYDGIDKVAHEHGLGVHYESEVRAADRLVSDVIGALPPGAALVVTSDHGQVQVDTPAALPHRDILAASSLVSGEGRFRWFHLRSGAIDDVADVARDAHGDQAWVVTRQQMIDEGWFGGPVDAEVAGRLGDLALVAHAPVAFLDPADTGETGLKARHGSLTSAEMRVPLLAWAG
ncbi:MAG: alkaline phosphatase family protein [Acidimicrobiales bacterium]